MPRFYFRPQPILTLIAVIGLGILISLGVWQKQRLEWKTELLASVEQAATAAPFTSLRDVQAAIDTGNFAEFRRIDIAANLLPMDAPFFVFTARDRDISWRKFQHIESGGVSVFADMGVIADAQRVGFTPASGPMRLAGYIRTAQWQEEPQSKSSPDRNRWFGFNPLPETKNWSEAADMRFFIETVEGVTRADNLPPKQPEIANNHFDYMLTWFAMALILCVFYVLIHIRDGRAGRRGNEA